MWGRASCQDKWGALNRKGTAWWAGKGPEVLSAHVRQSRICTFPGASGVALPVASCGGPGQPWRSEGDRSGPRPAPTSTPVPRSHQLKMIFRNSVIFFFFFWLSVVNEMRHTCPKTVTPRRHTCPKTVTPGRQRVKLQKRSSCLMTFKLHRLWCREVSC